MSWEHSSDGRDGLYGTPAQLLRAALDRIWFVERERSGP